MTSGGGRGQAPALRVRKQGPAQHLPLGVQRRPLAASTTRAGVPRRAAPLPGLVLPLGGLRKLTPLILAAETRLPPAAAFLQRKLLQGPTSVPTRQTSVSF